MSGIAVAALCVISAIFIAAGWSIACVSSAVERIAEQLREQVRVQLEDVERRVLLEPSQSPSQANRHLNKPRGTHPLTGVGATRTSPLANLLRLAPLLATNPHFASVNRPHGGSEIPIPEFGSTTQGLRSTTTILVRPAAQRAFQSCVQGVGSSTRSRSLGIVAARCSVILVTTRRDGWTMRPLRRRACAPRR